MVVTHDSSDDYDQNVETDSEISVFETKRDEE